MPILLAVSWITCGCVSEPVPSPATPASVKGQAVIADPLLGKWVRVANNVDNVPDATMDLRADGTAVFTYKLEKPVVWRYKREPMHSWAARRDIQLDGRVDVLDQMSWQAIGSEVVYFASPESGWQFHDTGGWLLFLSDKEQVLINPLTQAWCRPGDELRARKLAGLGEMDESTETTADILSVVLSHERVVTRARVDYSNEHPVRVVVPQWVKKDRPLSAGGLKYLLTRSDPRSGKVMLRVKKVFFKPAKASIKLLFDPEGVFLVAELLKGTTGWELESLKIVER